MSKDKIIIGKTKNKATVSICVNCNAYNIPHFNYDKGKKHYSIEFQIPVPLDYSNVMELKERTDLEVFFATYNEERQITNWQLAVKTWNENNNIQIPDNLHKPYYRNMIEELDNYIISTDNNRIGLIDGMQIYCDEDIETEPHFHVKLSNNSNVAIYFRKPKYLYPIYSKLSDEELEVLNNYLKSKCSDYIVKHFNIDTNWKYLIYAWNNQNANSQGSIYPHKEKLDENMEMPDYTKLNEE